MTLDTVRSVDLNADAGEGYGPWRMGDDEALLDVVTTVNVACGLHAGDPLIMRRTVAAAAARGVAVGAHPGPNDLWGFGRRHVAGERPADLATMVAYQVGALVAVARSEGAHVGHVKLHGALSNRAAEDAELAEAVAAMLATVAPGLAWLVPSGSAMALAGAAHALLTVPEGFPDREYDAHGSPVSRALPGAVIEDPEEVARRALALVRGTARSQDGSALSLAVASLCVHGDATIAVAAARAVRATLEADGVVVRSFLPAG